MTVPTYHGITLHVHDDLSHKTHTHVTKGQLREGRGGVLKVVLCVHKAVLSKTFIASQVQKVENKSKLI